MKKLKLLVVTLLALMVLPFCVNADSKEPIKVHIFRGEGCGYCKAALTFFGSIEDEYGKYFDLVEHEVWSNADNADLMTKVADHFNEKVDGVPYIIIGEKTYKGYTESYNEDIINQIITQYNSGKFVDIVAQIQKGDIGNEDNNTTTIIIIAVAIIGFVALFYFARDPKEEIGKEAKKEEKVVEKVETKPVAKKTTAKKTTTKKVAETKPAAKKTTTNKTTSTKVPAKKTTTKKATSTKVPAKKTTTKKATPKKTTKK